MVTVRLRRLGVALAVVTVIAAGRLLLGPWPTAILLSAGGLFWGLRAWYRFENRPTRPVRRVLLPELVAPHSPSIDDGHVGFARALATVALRYLEACEQETRRP